MENQSKTSPKMPSPTSKDGKPLKPKHYKSVYFRQIAEQEIRTFNNIDGLYSNSRILKS